MLSSRNPRRQPRRLQTTHVTLLLDMSGSMNKRRDETIREVNRYLDQLRRDGQRYRLTVKTFNEHVYTLISHKDIRDCGELEHSEYRPDGWTALLDAVGFGLKDVGYPYGNDRTLFVVITDGEENRSRHYELYQVRDMIDQRRSEDFQFVFLGSGPGSWQTGNRMGFNFSVATDWNDPRNSENIYKGLYTATNSMSSGGIISTSNFTTGSTEAKQNR